MNNYVFRIGKGLNFGIKKSDINFKIRAEIIELNEITPEKTDSSDYIYHVSDGAVTIDKYIGKSIYPEIPAALNGYPVKVLGAVSFSSTKVEYVYIPEGVDEIE